MNISFSIAQGLFIRALGGVYFFAFLSLLLQVDAFYSTKGIIPVKDLLQHYKNRNNKRIYYHFPTIFWLGYNDSVLKAGTILGLIA